MHLLSHPKAIAKILGTMIKSRTSSAQRNQVERLFRRIKRFRRIFTRYDKLNFVFLAFVHFALIIDALM
ncbi:MAG: transposase [Flavonifractor sp.]|nr:transposase [Flavonifractor sp.]